MKVEIAEQRGEWVGYTRRLDNGTIIFWFDCQHINTHEEEVDYGGLHHDSHGDLDWFDDWRTDIICDDCETVLETDDDPPEYEDEE